MFVVGSVKPLVPKERLADAAFVGRGEMDSVKKVAEEEFNIGEASVDSRTMPVVRDWVVNRDTVLYIDGMR